MAEGKPFVEDTVLASQYGLFDLLRRLRDDQLSIWPPEIFSRNMTSRRLFLTRSFFVNKPEYIEHVLLTNQQNYTKSELARRIVGPILGNGLILSEGDFWRRQRRIVAPAFHHKRIADFADVMAARAEMMLADWQSRQGSFDVCHDMMALTLEIINATMFSTDVSGSTAAVRRLSDVVVRQVFPNLLDLFGMPDWIPRFRNRELVAAMAEFEALLKNILAPRRADGADRGDLLSMLLAARDPETGEGMSEKQLRDEVVTIFGAGHETTGSALGWVWYMLARHPEIEAKLHDEVDRVLGGRRPSFSDLAELKYCRMLFDETLRLYPPVHATSRSAIAEDRIGGVRVPAGAMISISPYVTHRNPHLWPDPERFDPERFTPEAVAARHRFAYLPFGGGPRICIGMSFATIEAQIIIASVAQRYRLRLTPDHKVRPIGLLTLRAKDGIQVTLEKRLNI